jgi:hypothetical protein
MSRNGTYIGSPDRVAEAEDGSERAKRPQGKRQQGDQMPHIAHFSWQVLEKRVPVCVHMHVREGRKEREREREREREKRLREKERLREKGKY